MHKRAISHQPSAIGLIDTHCHLEMPAFDSDRDEVIQRALDAGIEAIITIGSDLKGNIGSLELSGKYDFIYSSIGIHPHDAKDFTEEIYAQLKEWATPPHPPLGKGGHRGVKIVAIGETGLDYHYDNSPRDVQKDVFKKHIELAMELDLPVVVHSREAEKDTLEILKNSGISNGVMHCFSGDIGMAERVMGMGLHISIAGPVTFKNAKKLAEVAKTIPDNYLLVETDAPYLTPEPLRGKRNEPSFIVNTARKIAELRGVSFEDIARISTLNAKRLFKIGELPRQGEIAYKIRDSLYLNITNRCTNKCSFCVRFHSDYVKGHNLRLSHEPEEGELRAVIGDPSKYKEIVFCGYGEPLLRLELVKSLAGWIKENRGRIRINTNGHGNLIHNRNILPELNGIADAMSISLDAHDEKTYDKICAPAFKNAFREVLSFTEKAKNYIPEVQLTIVDVDEVDVSKCRDIAKQLGVKLRIRKRDVVG